MKHTEVAYFDLVKREKKNNLKMWCLLDTVQVDSTDLAV